MEQFAVELLKLTHPEELHTLLVQGPNGNYLETLQYSVDLERKNVSNSRVLLLIISESFLCSRTAYIAAQKYEKTASAAKVNRKIRICR